MREGGAGVRRRACPWRRRPGDEGFATVQALVFLLVLGTLSLLMLSELARGLRQATFARTHGQTLHTALAGLQAGLARLRSTVDPATGYGLVTGLPCEAGTSSGTLSGRLDPAGAERWQATVYYLASADPAGLTEAQVAAAALPCPLSAPPASAYLLVRGERWAPGGSAPLQGSRTVHGVYDFTTTTRPALGGQISHRVSGLCWDAGPAPAVGSVVTYQPCAAGGTPSQSWYYRPDLSVQAYGSPPANLCLDYRQRYATPSSQQMTLQTCIGSGRPGSEFDVINKVYPLAGQRFQEFATTDYARPVTAAGAEGADYCVRSASPTSSATGLYAVGEQLAMSSPCSSAAYLTAAAAVGAGAAGGVVTGLPGRSEQLVATALAGRCLAVDGGVPANGLVTSACRQAPDPSTQQGDQRFEYSGTATTPGVLSTFNDVGPANRRYSTVCLESDGSTVRLPGCSPGAPGQQWRLTGYRAGDRAGSYLVQDALGRCLQADPTAGSTGPVRVATCDGSQRQKWNAPPSGSPATIRQLGES